MLFLLAHMSSVSMYSGSRSLGDSQTVPGTIKMTRRRIELQAEAHKLLHSKHLPVSLCRVTLCIDF